MRTYIMQLAYLPLFEKLPPLEPTILLKPTSVLTSKRIPSEETASRLVLWYQKQFG